MVALRPVDALAGEVKRLYVRPAVRHRGVGRGLMIALIQEARAAGYAELHLETLPAMREAQALYRALGFCQVTPPNDDDRTIHMILRLTQTFAPNP